MLQDAEFWEHLYAEWRAAHENKNGAELHRIGQTARIAVQSRQEASMDWLVSALGDAEKKRFVIEGLEERMPHLPTRLMTAILWAGILEADPAESDRFLHACVRVWGSHKVQDALRDVLEHGRDDEKSGAARALRHLKEGE